MSSFGGLLQTRRGRNLQAKAQTGVKLQYTRIALGDGHLGSTPIADLNALRNQKKSLDIQKLNVLTGGRVLVGSTLSNQDMQEGFYFREIGIFAQDPDVGEVLYCYGNAGELAEYIPPAGGADVIEKSINIQTSIGNAQNVTAVIDDSLVFATEKRLQELEESITQQMENMDAVTTEELEQELTKLEKKLGNLSELQTEEKENVVQAINEVRQALTAHQAEVANQLVNQASNLTRLSRHNTQQDRSLAYLMLKQDATDRINAPHTFADDFGGNSFGLTYNEAESENIVFHNGSALMLESTVDTTEIQDVPVVSQSFSTRFATGRKLVQLDNGWFVVGVYDSNTIHFYCSQNGGNNWSYVGYRTWSSWASVFSLESRGTMVYGITPTSTGQLSSFNFDVLKVDQPNLVNAISWEEIRVESNQSSFAATSLILNPETDELHGVWSGRNSSYPNSDNIRYVRGVINADGNVTWNTVEQVTLFSITGRHMRSPSITVDKNNTPIIIFSSTGHAWTQTGANHSNSNIGVLKRDSSLFNVSSVNSNWSGVGMYTPTPYFPQSPSTIYIPSDINGLPEGRLWVAWDMTDATDPNYSNIFAAYSDDMGKTWSDVRKITNNNNVFPQQNPSITANKNNEVFVVWEGTKEEATYYRVRMTSYINNTWGSIKDLTPNPGVTTNGMDQRPYPTTLYNLSLDFSTPLFVYRDSINSKVGFYGTWVDRVDTPTLTASLTYDLPSTDYIGAFLQREGSVNVEAYVNNELIEAELIDNEYAFTKAIDEDVPIKLRLELSRDSIDGGNNDKLTRLLGGRA